jgi:hypothetical protein
MAEELSVGMKVRWADDRSDYTVRSLNEDWAMIKPLGERRTFSVPTSELDWAPRTEPPDTQERADSRLLDTATALEGDIHPESPSAWLSPRLGRIPRAWRWAIMAADGVATAILLILYLASEGSLAQITYWVSWLVTLFVLLSLALVEFPRRTLRLLRAIDAVIYHSFPWLSAVALAALVALWALGQSAQQRLEVTIGAIGVGLIVRAINDVTYGHTYRRRFFRLAFARHTQRLMVGLVIFAASWSFLLATTRSGTPKATDSLALAGAIVAAATGSIGAAIRLAVRQRKHATQLVAAVDELGLNVRLEIGRQKVAESWLSLDRVLMGGADTGVPLFATRSESEHMRALLTACLLRLTQQAVPDESWKLLTRAVNCVSTWSVEECTSSLLAYLAATRRHFAFMVDTTA